MSSVLRIFPNKKQKFILVRITSKATDALAMWSNPDIEWHNDIVQEMTSAGYPIQEVLGGGWLFFSPETRELYVWGKSDRFGPAPRALIKEVVEQELPDTDVYLDQEPP